VVAARGGNEALSLFEQLIPDAIILDLMMPKTDGFEVLEKIRSSDLTAHIPVLILTAKHLTKNDLKFLKRNNIHELIQKGDVKRAELLNAVRSMVGEYKSVSQVPLHPKQKTENKPTLLIVEDNPDNMTTAKAILAKDYQIIEAVDGIEAVEKANMYHPELILMDIALPKMDGIEAYKKIRENKKLEHIPIIALTASAMTEDREAILAHGFNAYIPKPIDDKIFFETINQTLYGK
jgi:CheY-like chemotaxis protein